MTEPNYNQRVQDYLVRERERERGKEKVLEELKLKPSELELLLYLGSHNLGVSSNGQTVRQTFNEKQLKSESTVSASAIHLWQEKYLEKFIGPESPRGIFVRLTPKGEEAYQRAYKLLEEAGLI